jgi:hypothetical protein
LKSSDDFGEKNAEPSPPAAPAPDGPPLAVTTRPETYNKNTPNRSTIVIVPFIYMYIKGDFKDRNTRDKKMVLPEKNVCS